MEITATYPDYKTVTVSVDKWDTERVIEAFMELGVLFVTTKED
jgi:hypothetical protein